MRVTINVGHDRDVREIAVWHHFITMHQHFECLFLVAFRYQLFGKAGVESAHQRNQAGVVLAVIQLRIVKATPSVRISFVTGGVGILDSIQTAVIVKHLHQVVIKSIRIDAPGFTIRTCGVADGNQTIGETFELEVFLQAEIRLRAGR